jgi:AraC-like DNA-binding protein
VVEPLSETVLQRPAAPVAPYVEQYVGYRLLGFPPGLHRGVPSRHLTFIVSIGDPIDVVAQTDPSQSPARYRCVIGGLQASHALISHRGDQEGIGIELTPEGCRALFGLPAAALWNTSLELDDVTSRLGDELWERLQVASDWPARFAECDRVLLRLLDRSTTVPLAAELRRSWQLLSASHGAMGVRDLAAEVGWSRQHLRRRFTEEFGLAPKLAGRVIRFDHARHTLQRAGSGATIADVAATTGYYDQAHLHREFAQFAGCGPTELLAGDLPSVQDEDHLARGR